MENRSRDKQGAQPGKPNTSVCLLLGLTSNGHDGDFGLYWDGYLWLVSLSDIREFKKTTTATVTSVNERFNEENNGWAHAL